MRALELGKDLALAPARQIGARGRAGHEKPGKADRGRHWRALSSWRESFGQVLPKGYACTRPAVKVP
ncbi:hypothetical protein I603_2647 [Erythrobacter dokdonensis DSW-74]|uniref:Uncharacterized protein n=1 Tax=Erythrobacter dokdonensis DSW-74 TaxID=1300349 RepID=A0A1A7BEA2_9SPHN|nr:hypothetical protein I603_2647 [Erythrobacter dokdonensis DSW-74]